MPYQTVGSLHLDFEGFRSYANYCRELDLDRAVATTRFTSGGVDYCRETFASLTDNVVVMRLTASRPGSISFKARYTSPMPGTRRSVTPDGLLLLEGKGTDFEGIEGKVRFVTLLQCQLDGGSQKIVGDTALVVDKANSVLLCISTGTNFKNYEDLSGDALRPKLKNICRAALRCKLMSGPGTRIRKPTGNTSAVCRSTWDATPRPTSRLTCGCVNLTRSQTRSSRLAFPVWPLPAHQFVPTGRAGCQSARYLELPEESGMGWQIYY